MTQVNFIVPSCLNSPRAARCCRFECKQSTIVTIQAKARCASTQRDMAFQTQLSGMTQRCSHAAAGGATLHAPLVKIARAHGAGRAHQLNGSSTSTLNASRPNVKCTAVTDKVCGQAACLVGTRRLCVARRQGLRLEPPRWSKTRIAQAALLPSRPACCNAKARTPPHDQTPPPVHKCSSSANSSVRSARSCVAGSASASPPLPRPSRPAPRLAMRR